jgi:phenylalanyl-tRNA synthetase beta chain
MKISYSWLKNYVDVKIDPKKLAYLLTMAGTSVTSCDKAGGGYIFEFEITSNRPDCLSLIGIARETAAILGKKLKIPKDLKSALPAKRAAGKELLKVTIKDPELCGRYTARIIRNVDVGPSPDWLKEKIISAGLRPVNNIVDITNFVLFETGQPMHAFDLDKIKGDISIRRGIKGENIITIDNVPRPCGPDMLVIADTRRPIAIAGVMGGSGTEVNKMTKNILLESAFFNPISIRRTSRALALSSESSYRFERGVNSEMVLRASDRGARLIESLADGEIGPLIDTGKKASKSKPVDFDLERANKILGVTLTKSKAGKILKTLGFSLQDKKRSMKVTVPGFRRDVKNEIDITEELARIYGYEKIPLTIPRIIGNVKIKDFTSILKERSSEALTRLGLNEIITYSLINKESINGLSVKDTETVAIKNPLSIDQEIMRPSMLPGMLGVISYNLNRKARRLSFFENGKIYKEKKNSYIEEPVVSIALAGVKEESWRGRAEEFGFFDIKGIFEKLLGDIGITNILFKKYETEGLNKDIASTIEHQGEVIARLGEVDTKICEKFNIEKRVFYGELYVGKLINRVKLDKKYIPLGRYPSIRRDISIIADKHIASFEITNIIKETGKSLVKKTSLIGSYEGKQIPEGKQGLLYRIEFRSDERTLKDTEVDSLHSEIKKTLSEKLNISFR